jgi:hypothetical protein
MLKVKDAKEELAKKSYLEIQKETAWKWASRAAASYELAVEEKDIHRKVAIYQVAEEYWHESLEHAALYEDDGKLLKGLQEVLNPYRDKAGDDLKDSLKS